MKRWMAWVAVAVLFVVACKEGAPNAEGQVPAKAPAGEKEDKQFSIDVETAPVKAGAKADAKVVIKASKGYHWNENYPASFKVSATGDVVKLTKSEFDAAAFQAGKDAPQATLVIPVEGAKAGEAKLEGTANFSVCNDEACLVYRNEKVAFTMPVE